MTNGLPPLPLIDGALFIDNSSWMEGFSSCYRFLQYKSLNLRIPSTEKPSLNFGSAIHLALEYRYKMYRNKPVDQAYYNTVSTILTEFFAVHEPPMDDWRTLNWAMTVIRQYNEKYACEEFSLLSNDAGDAMVEMSFALPLFTYRVQDNNDFHNPPKDIPIVYTGKIDLPIVLDGRTWVMDHKTTSLLGPSFFDGMRMSSQQRGYVWAFQELTAKRTSGYVVNAIRTKEPPKYVLEGKPSAYGKKQSPSEWWNDSLQRERFEVEPKAIDEWKNNTIDLVEEFFFHYTRGYMPQKTMWCNQYGRCPYYDVCRLDSADRGMFLASGQFTDNTWSPLRQPTQTKQ